MKGWIEKMILILYRTILLVVFALSFFFEKSAALQMLKIAAVMYFLLRLRSFPPGRNWFAELRASYKWSTQLIVALLLIAIGLSIYEWSNMRSARTLCSIFVGGAFLCLENAIALATGWAKPGRNDAPRPG